MYIWLTSLVNAKANSICLTTNKLCSADCMQGKSGTAVHNRRVCRWIEHNVHDRCYIETQLLLVWEGNWKWHCSIMWWLSSITYWLRETLQSPAERHVVTNLELISVQAQLEIGITASCIITMTSKCLSLLRSR